MTVRTCVVTGSGRLDSSGRGVVRGGLTGTRPSRDPATEGNTVVLLDHGRI